MNPGKANIMSYLKRLVLTMVLSAILLQLSAQTVAFLSDSDYQFELVGFDGQEESEQEEKQDDDSKDEKIEIQVLDSYNDLFSFLSERSSYNPLESLWNFSMDIPIPPPERI